MYAFCRSVELPTSLAQIGLESVTNQKLEAAILPVLQNKQSYLHNVRFEVTSQGIIEALRMADVMGRDLSE